eukprot:m.61198 g.61198  ORF g.61198 m.61198 type:complete len:369 (+) comp7328_c0_seq1:391-1497(+)
MGLPTQARRAEHLGAQACCTYPLLLAVSICLKVCPTASMVVVVLVKAPQGVHFFLIARKLAQPLHLVSHGYFRFLRARSRTCRCFGVRLCSSCSSSPPSPSPGAFAGRTMATVMEICIDSVESARAAETAGAARVELCSALSEGGLTPSLGMVRAVLSATSLPVFLMLRPRGGDFCYTDDEFQVMKHDLAAFRAAASSRDSSSLGFVVGMLLPDGSVDKPRLAELLALCGDHPTTFHRAFDMASSWRQALADVIDLGFSRILTSGQDANCLEGAPVLAAMIQEAAGRITIVPGGGITESNIERIITQTGACEFHCSARESVASDMVFRKGGISMSAGYFPSEFSLKRASASRAQTILAAAAAAAAGPQ